MARRFLALARLALNFAFGTAWAKRRTHRPARGRAAATSLTEGGYAVVVSKATNDDPQWKAVVDALVAKHGATVIVYDKSVDDALPELRRQFPRYACFVAKPTRGRAAISSPRSAG